MCGYELDIVETHCRRPTFAETKRVMAFLLAVHEADSIVVKPEDTREVRSIIAMPKADPEHTESVKMETETAPECESTRLHRAASSGDADKVRTIRQ